MRQDERGFLALAVLTKDSEPFALWGFSTSANASFLTPWTHLSDEGRAVISSNMLLPKYEMPQKSLTSHAISLATGDYIIVANNFKVMFGTESDLSLLKNAFYRVVPFDSVFYVEKKYPCFSPESLTRELASAIMLSNNEAIAFNSNSSDYYYVGERGPLIRIKPTKLKTSTLVIPWGIRHISFDDSVLIDNKLDTLVIPETVRTVNAANFVEQIVVRSTYFLNPQLEIYYKYGYGAPQFTLAYRYDFQGCDNVWIFNGNLSKATVVHQPKGLLYVGKSTSTSEDVVRPLPDKLPLKDIFGKSKVYAINN